MRGMEREGADWLPVYGIEDDCILSRQGDYTVGYRIHKPEIFCMSATEYEELHQSFVRAMKVLPPGTILHLQDWYVMEKYGADPGGDEKSWVGQSSERFFNERPWLDHSANLFITRRAANRRRASSAVSGLIYPQTVAPEAMDHR